MQKTFTPPAQAKAAQRKGKAMKKYERQAIGKEKERVGEKSRASAHSASLSHATWKTNT